jgi:pyruvate,water dikinase
MEKPNLRDTPWVLFLLLKFYVQRETTVESYRAQELRLRADAERELDRSMRRHPLRKAVLRMGLSTLRRLIRNRENSRYCRSELFSYSKNVFRGIAANLVRDGALHSSDDIYFLAVDDVFGFIDGTGVTENLQGLVELRREEFHRNKQRDTGIEITTWGPVRRNDIFTAPADSHVPDGDREDTLRGLGSSAGKVIGVARVITDPNQPVEIGDTGILIARETDPGWLFLMLSAKAIVVERGSMLSHTAITGRKFGIPTVVAVPGATTRIPNGARIEVDGSAGIVTILDRGL